MPRIPDASSVTRFRAIQSSIVVDPSIKSASYLPSQVGLLSSLRSSTEGRGLFPGQSALATSIFRRYVNPRTQGFIVGGTPATPSSVPRIVIDCNGKDFADQLDPPTEDYIFDGPPPASTFEVVLTNAVNVEYIGTVTIRDAQDPPRDIMQNVLISCSPTWTNSAFTLDISKALLRETSTPGSFPTNAVLTYSGVPLEGDLDMQFQSVYLSFP
jgi:hypothetical protein